MSILQRSKTAKGNVEEVRVLFAVQMNFSINQKNKKTMINKKVLHFLFRGECYQVNEKGEIKTERSGNFSPTWIFLGGTEHHWSNHVTVTLQMAFEKPELLNGCLGFDEDHGTTREWSGSYYGKLPRITGTYITIE